MIHTSRQESPRQTLAEIVHDLTRPSTTTVAIRTGWKYPNRTGPTYTNHRRVHQSLLDQLRAAVRHRPLVGPNKPVQPASSDPKTQPRFDTDAFDTLRQIETETRQWLTHLGIPSAAEKIAATITGNLISVAHAIKTADAMTDTIAAAIETLRAAAAGIRTTIEPDMRALLAAEPDMDRETQRAVHADARNWRNRCRVIGGWEQPPARPNARCMNCDQLPGPGAGLRVRFEGGDGQPAALHTAACLSCGRTWDAENVGLLAEHIRREQEQPADQRQNVP